MDNGFLRLIHSWWSIKHKQGNILILTWFSHVLQMILLWMLPLHLFSYSPSFLAEHDTIWSGISFWSFGVSFVHSQLFANLQPNPCLGEEKWRCCASPAQQEQEQPWLNTIFSANPKQNSKLWRKLPHHMMSETMKWLSCVFYSKIRVCRKCYYSLAC